MQGSVHSAFHRRLAAVLALLACPAIPGAAWAQSEGEGDAASFLAPAPAEGDDASAFLAGQEPDQPAVIAAPEQDPELQLVEDPTQPYYELGLRTHVLFIPYWLVEAAGDLWSFPDVIGWALGVEFTYRKNGFDIVPAVWWGSYAFEGFTRENGDPESETEYLKSDLGVIWFTVDFISGTDFYPWFGITYGGSIGIGFTTGDVIRNEAVGSDATGWQSCRGPGNPADPDCEPSGGHYGPIPYNDGFGSIWSAYPYLSGMFGFRWKPLRNLVIGGPELRIGLPELFSLGLRVNYMF